MTEVLCASPRCRAPGVHTTACLATSVRCRGCGPPARAAAGLRLCWSCTDGIPRDATKAALLYDKCQLIISATGSPGSGMHGGISLNLAASEARTAIRARLLAWTRHIADDRDIDLPGHWRFDPLPTGVQGPLHRRGWRLDDDNHALAAYIGVHAPWLATQPDAGRVADGMAELVTIGTKAAYPDRISIVPIGACIELTEQGEPCPGTIKALMRQEDSLLPSEAVCDHHPDHVWGPAQWYRLGRRLTALAEQRALELAEMGITTDARIRSTVAGHGGWPERRNTG